VSKPSDVVSISILGKDYRIGCDPGTEQEVISAARLLDSRMREVRDNGKVVGADRIAVMVAVNLAHELLQEKSDQDSAAGSANKRLRALCHRIEIALNDTTQLEL
jgi:cell division protein ZapA